MPAKKKPKPETPAEQKPVFEDKEGMVYPDSKEDQHAGD